MLLLPVDAHPDSWPSAENSSAAAMAPGATEQENTGLSFTFAILLDDVPASLAAGAAPALGRS
jgi:hypothetical protein